jgi:transcriptional regulator with XRE-family HTH domain
MTAANARRFDAETLYAALDAQRRSRGLSWRQVSLEVGVSASTLTRTAQGGLLEGDGMLAMVRWLGRSPESFSRGGVAISTRPMTVADAGTSGKHLRFDTKALYAALDARRRSRGMSWQQVALEVGGVNASGLIRLAKGGRIGAHNVLAVAGWLGRTVASFTRLTDW